MRKKSDCITVQLIARGLEFRIKEVVGLYLQCREKPKALNTCVRSYCAFVFAYAKSSFFMTRLKYVSCIYISILY